MDGIVVKDFKAEKDIAVNQKTEIKFIDVNAASLYKMKKTILKLVHWTESILLNIYVAV